MLITAQFNEIEPFSDVIFEEVFRGDLPVVVSINATPVTSIAANVIKSVVPNEITSALNTDIVVNKIKNTEEFEIDATPTTDFLPNRKKFADVSIESDFSTDILASYKAGLDISIESDFSIDIIPNRKKYASMLMISDASTDIYASQIKNIPNFEINVTPSTDISLFISTQIESFVIDAAPVVSIEPSLKSFTEQLLIGSQFLLDSEYHVRFNNAGDPLTGIGGPIVEIGIIKNIEAFEINADVTTDIEANVI